jgi:hypothetical protein
MKAALAVLLCLAGAAWAGDTPGLRGLNNPPEMQNAVKERNLKAPGKLTGQAPPKTLGRMAPPAKARVGVKTGPDGKDTPESFRERHRLHKGAAPSQTSRDVMLNQRIQGRAPSGLQRRVPPAKEQPQETPEKLHLLETPPAGEPTSQP